MNSPTLTIIVALAVMLGSGRAARAADPTADQLLQQMSTRLASARTFSFKATREIDAALLEGRDVPEKARIALKVQRPDKLAGTSISQAGTRRVVADGTTLSLLDQKANHYAAIPMRTNLDGLVERLDAQYGFVPPLAEFASSNPYADLRRDAHTISYSGKAKTGGGFLGLGGVECHRISLAGKSADAELWIAVSDQLPRKLIATFRQEGRPQVRIDFTAWNLAAPVTSADFTFTPPAGADKIEMWTTAKMQSTRKK